MNALSILPKELLHLILAKCNLDELKSFASTSTGLTRLVQEFMDVTMSNSKEYQKNFSFFLRASAHGLHGKRLLMDRDTPHLNNFASSLDPSWSEHTPFDYYTDNPDYDTEIEVQEVMDENRWTTMAACVDPILEIDVSYSNTTGGRRMYPLRLKLDAKRTMMTYPTNDFIEIALDLGFCTLMAPLFKRIRTWVPYEFDDTDDDNLDPNRREGFYVYGYRTLSYKSGPEDYDYNLGNYEEYSHLIDLLQADLEHVAVMTWQYQF